MDDDGVLARIDSWLPLVDRFREIANTYSAALHSSRSTGDLRERRDQLDDQVRTDLALLRSVARSAGQDQLAGFMVERPADVGHHWVTARKAVVEFRAWITQRDERVALVGPVGPQMSASALHPVIWGAAAALWDDGHLRPAIQTAGSALEAYLQRAGTYISGQDLGQLFALTPPTVDVPRLRFDGIDPDSQTWNSAHNGAAMLVRGAMMAVRNRVSHEGWPDPEPDPDEALEMLAIFSYVARLVDLAYVDEAPTP